MSTVKLSKTSKLDGINSWSLNALETCQGSIGADGQLVDACKGCYATTNFYLMQSVRAPRDFNKQAWKNESFVTDFVKALDSSRYFRWFDSGDMYSLELAEKIYQIMSLTPWVKHWLPTRMHKFPKYQKIIALMEKLPNVVVRLSSDSVQGETIKGNTTSTIFSDTVPSGAFECKAYENSGKCNGCRACYSKDVSIVAYRAHGVKMAKVIKILQVKG